MEQYAVTCVFFIDKEKEITSVSRVERYVRDYLVDTDKLNGNEGFQIVQTEEINEQE